MILSLNDFGTKYNSYNDIKGGQITYYTDKSTNRCIFQS